jgi:DNA-binding IclR family transcriptional regulator
MEHMVRRRVRLEKPLISSQPKELKDGVKSAHRALGILAYFDYIQRPAMVMEIVEALKLPQSSASMLLRSLVTDGYLKFDPVKRTYVSSMRVALLGNWLRSPFYAEGPAMRAMRELNENTGLTISLATRNGNYAQYIHVLQAKDPSVEHLALGTARPLPYSGVGHVILSSLPQHEVQRIVLRYNAEVEDLGAKVNMRDLIAELALINQRGYAVTESIPMPYSTTIAVALERLPGEPPLVLALGATSKIMRESEDKLIAALMTAAKECAPGNDLDHSASRYLYSVS